MDIAVQSTLYNNIHCFHEFKSETHTVHVLLVGHKHIEYCIGRMLVAMMIFALI